MRVYVPHLCRALGLLCALSLVTPAQASTCKSFDDTSNTFFTSLKAQLGNVPGAVLTSFNEVADAFPQLATCVAALDTKAIYTSLGTSSGSQNVTQVFEDPNFNLNSPANRTNACELLKTTVIPGVESVMKDVIMDALDSTGGCCDGLTAQIKTLFGDSLDTMVTKLAEGVVNIGCSQRTFTNLAGTATSEVCGYSIVNSFNPILASADNSTMTSLLQIPNNQLCNAFGGQEFTTTQGAKVTLPFGTNNIDSMGICTQPLDEFVQYLASWRIWSLQLNAGGATITLSDLFASGKALRSDLFAAYLTTSTNLPMMVMRSIDKLVVAANDYYSPSGSGYDGGSGDYNNGGDTSSSYSPMFMVDMFVEWVNASGSTLQLHVPNSGGCNYSGQTVTEVYPADVANTSNTSTTTATTKKSAGGRAILETTVSAIALLVAAAIML